MQNQLLNLVSTTSHPRLKEALTYIVSTGGKYIRPRIMELAAEMFRVEHIDNYRLAVECVHIFSLIHDDLPALDNDDFRRGLPTMHKKFDEATAILAGDYLFSLAFSLIDNIAVAKLLAETTKTLINGQFIDVYGKLDSKEDYETLFLEKTAKMFMFSAITPAILAGESTENMAIFGENFGKLFQLVDDMDDFGKDKAANILNIISAIEAKALAKNYFENAKKAISSYENSNNLLLELQDVYAKALIFSANG
jgi:geranylgeranyl pyrophosphate synthase